MIALIQRVNEAKVVINNENIGEIGKGVLAFIGVEKNDTTHQVKRLLEKILSYRIFSDAEDKMNLSIKDIQGGLLLVPQFTLVADTHKGNRPSFSSAASPDIGKKLFNELISFAEKKHQQVEVGQFGADMKVALVNDGPVTFWLQVNP